jgi:hypothetical protein
MFGVIGRRYYPYMGDRLWPRPKPGWAKLTFQLLAWLVILQIGIVMGWWDSCGFSIYGEPANALRIYFC